MWRAALALALAARTGVGVPVVTFRSPHEGAWLPFEPGARVAVRASVGGLAPDARVALVLDGDVQLSLIHI